MNKHHVLVAIDDIEFSTHIIKTAMKFLDKDKVIIHLLNVLETNTAKSDLFYRSQDEYLEEEGGKVSYVLLEEYLEKHGFSVQKTKYVEGKPAEEILRFVEKNNIELVVIGSHKKKFFERFWIGSTSHNVIKNSKCSSLVIKPYIIPEYDFSRSQNNLIATDGSDYILKSAKVFSNLFDLEKIKNTLVHVRVPIEVILPSDALQYSDFSLISAESQKNAEELLEKSKEQCENTKLAIHTTLLKEGRAGVEIIDEIKENEYDLVVVGSHGEDPLAEFFMGSVSSQVYENSPITTLIVK